MARLPSKAPQSALSRSSPDSMSPRPSGSRCPRPEPIIGGSIWLWSPSKDNVTVYREDRIFFDVAATRVAVRPVAPGGTAKFLGSDGQLHGDWNRKYGAEGFEIVGDVSKLPAYASVHYAEDAEARVVDATWRGSDSQRSLWTWQAKSDDRRALARPSGKDRMAACWYGDMIVFDLDVGKSSRDVTMYFLDWDQQGVREQTVQIRSGGEVLDRRTLTAFHGGKYLTWTIQGRVQVEIRKLTGKNAVISGIFFDR